MNNTNTNEKNALTELAEEMEAGLIHLEYDTIPHWVEVYGKAQRIIEELAKVEKPLGTVGTPHLADILESDKNRAAEIVRNCRAIAAEGTDND